MECVYELCSREPTCREVMVATQCHLRIARSDDDEDDLMEDSEREKCVKLLHCGVTYAASIRPVSKNGGCTLRPSVRRPEITATCHLCSCIHTYVCS